MLAAVLVISVANLALQVLACFQRHTAIQLQRRARALKAIRVREVPIERTD